MWKTCNDCLNKDLRIETLESRNRFLKQKVDELENISFFNWCTWFLFGERMSLRRPLNEFKADE